MKKIISLCFMALSFITLDAKAQPAISPFVSSLTEALVKQCPKNFKYGSVEKHKRNMMEYIKANGKEMATDLIKGSRDKIKENGGCSVAVTDMKTKTKEQLNTLNVMLK